MCAFVTPPGANAKLRYQITSGNALGTFDVEPEVGTIFVAQPLDYEREQRYELRLVASDGRWENQTLVVVQVANKNDEAPVFQQTEYHGAVSEEMSQLPVFVLEVRRRPGMDECLKGDGGGVKRESGKPL